MNSLLDIFDWKKVHVFLKSNFDIKNMIENIELMIGNYKYCIFGTILG